MLQIKNWIKTPLDILNSGPVVPASLPEAPASANFHVEVGGRRVQLTIRGDGREYRYRSPVVFDR